MTRRIVESTGRTVEEATGKGLAVLGLSREQATVRVLDQGVSGSNHARVRIMEKGKETEGNIVQGDIFSDGNSEAVEDGPSLSHEETQADIPSSDLESLPREPEKCVEEIVTRALVWMGAGISEISVEASEGRIIAKVRTRQPRVFSSDPEEVLSSMQVLVQRVLEKVVGEKMRVVLEIDEILAKQDERVVVVARRAADEVRKSKEAWRLEPMSSRERWIVHDILKDDPEVETASEGEGQYRKVVVKPR